ncbi:hypothetical protein [Notoacmeibacter marinus]|uniref:hypothetical protein n=1 Tax=Notoacmeibacter marinus TaxID=1876515 RepID=UPI000DF2580E|nr:hypothetical protein [Notoacmeibacter marinus]
MIENKIAPTADSIMARRLVMAAVLLAAMTAAVLGAGHRAGQTLSLGGHSDRTQPIEIVIGNNVLSVPENMIRHEAQRRAAEYSGLELYLRWPELTGYSQGATDIFNSQSDQRALLFVTLERAAMSRDMSGRYASVYRPILREPGIAGPPGLTLRAFRPSAGYENELLASGRTLEGELYVARCLAGVQGRQAMAGCERDVHIGDGLSMTYRFPRELLGHWQTMDRALKKRISHLIR